MQKHSTKLIGSSNGSISWESGILILHARFSTGTQIQKYSTITLIFDIYSNLIETR
jgi:hypothetical protein